MQTSPNTLATVLIVDDEKSICDILNQFLKRQGYKTLVARSAEEAIEILTNSPVDMVLTDIKMPGLSGVDLVKWIKERNKHLPVILTTGFPTLDTAIEALKLGAYDYLTKPFHLEEIGEKIRRSLLSRKLEEENILFSSLVSLHEVTRVLASTHDPNELNRTFLDYCTKLIKADGGALSFFENSTHDLFLREFVGLQFGPEFYERETNKQIAMQLLSADGPLLWPSTETNSQYSQLVPAEIESMIMFVLRTPKRIIGVLTLIRANHSQPFSDLDLEIINVLASQASIAIENVRLYQNIRDNYLKTIRGFALAVEAKDRYTHGHSENVMKYTIVLAKKLGLSDTEIEQVKYAGLLHDIGKIGVPELILNKPGKLTDEEFEEIKKHPELGARIIADVPFLKSLVPLVLHHHEFFNGSGYPQGIAGNDIPLGARILCVCDAFEAMTSDRPYRQAMPFEKALSILEQNKQKQFDPAIVDLFKEIFLAGNASLT